MKAGYKEVTLICGVLPIFLWGLTWLAGGFHYETNDDLIMSFIARGITFGQPVSDYSIYFHGFGQAFVWLYAQFPAVPWYGVVLYLLLFLSTQLAFWFLYSRLRNKLSLPALLVLLLLFYLANWYEHVFWFNYMRVPFLLAGLALINAMPLAGKTAKPNQGLLYGLALLFFLSLCIRPGAAFLGVLVVLPVVVFCLAGASNRFQLIKQRLLPFVIAGLAFFVFLQLKSSESANVYRQLDTLKSGVLDYQWCCSEPEEPGDKLVLAGIDHWFIADVKVWQPFLNRENTYPDWPYIFKTALPGKSKLALRALVFDQFLILGLIFGWLVILYKNRREVSFRLVLGTQVYFWLLILMIALVLKLPPRVLTPALGLFFLVNLTFLPNNLLLLRKIPAWFFGLIFLLTGVQVYKIANRISWQQNQQAKAENFIRNIRENYAGKTVVTADFGGELRSLSPFQNYDLGSNRVLFLTGWHTLDPHFTQYLQALTGNAEVSGALNILSRNPNAAWILTPDFKTFLTQYMVHFYGDAAGLKTLQETKSLPDSAFKVYTVQQ